MTRARKYYQNHVKDLNFLSQIRLIRPAHDIESDCGNLYEDFEIGRSIGVSCKNSRCDFKCGGGRTAIPGYP